MEIEEKLALFSAVSIKFRNLSMKYKAENRDDQLNELFKLKEQIGELKQEIKNIIL